MLASAAAVPRRLPDERAAVSHRFTIGGREMLLTVGLHPDGAPGELFIRMARPDPTLSGLLDAFAAMTTIALERGASLESLAEACVGSRSEPSGATSNPEIAMATSVIDYVFRWMTARFPAK
jgi:ribonucleoside-diphosphate reductase alpha chain